jgi:hypothetical protein
VRVKQTVVVCIEFRKVRVLYQLGMAPKAGCMLFTVCMAALASTDAFLCPTTSSPFSAAAGAVKAAGNLAARRANYNPKNNCNQQGRKAPTKFKCHSIDSSQPRRRRVTIIGTFWSDYQCAAVGTGVQTVTFARCGTADQLASTVVVTYVSVVVGCAV